MAAALCDRRHLRTPLRINLASKLGGKATVGRASSPAIITGEGLGEPGMHAMAVNWQLIN